MDKYFVKVEIDGGTEAYVTRAQNEKHALTIVADKIGHKNFTVVRCVSQCELLAKLSTSLGVASALSKKNVI